MGVVVGAPSVTLVLLPALSASEPRRKVLPDFSPSLPPASTVSAPLVLPEPDSVAPLLTVTGPAARLPLSTSVPALTSVLPVIPLTPFSVSVPLPTLVRLPLPRNWPSKTALVLPMPALSAPRVQTVPAPLRLLTEAALLSLTVAPAATFRFGLLPSVLPAAMVSVPWRTSSVPVKMLVTPENVRSPRPVLASVPLPAIRPLLVRSASLASSSVTGKLMVTSPGSACDCWYARRLLPLTTNGPLPSAPSRATVSVPPLSSTPPAKVLLPPSSRLPVPLLINLAPGVPLIVPLRPSALLPLTVRLAFSATSLASSTAALLVSVLACATVNAPVPRAWLLPTVRVPPDSVVPP